jgi:DGQHR domain-containing protein
MNKFEEQVSSLFADLKINFFSLGNEQVLLKDFHESAPPGDAFEFDGFILHGRTCIVVEVTEQVSKQTEKIRRFAQHAAWLKDTKLDMRTRFAKFHAIPRNRLRQFEDVAEWRYLYISTSTEIREKKIVPASFPETKGKLSILGDEDWAYLRLLAKSVGSWAASELFASLNLHPGGAESSLERKFISLKRKILIPRLPKADIYVTYFTVEELLTMSRVLRYQRLPMGVESDLESNAGYQRLLSETKLKSIRELIRQEPQISFPNALTLVSEDCEEIGDTDKLRVPYRYASLDIIDGQHRLFAYADDAIRKSIRTSTDLMATIIRFQKDSKRSAAQLFVTINKNQAKVKRELIVLTSYDAMNGDDGEAVAGKVLIEVSEEKTFALFERLRTRPMIRSEDSIPITTVAIELSRMLEPNFLENLGIDQRSSFINEMETSGRKFKKRTERLRIGKHFMKRLFGIVKQQFKNDFTGESNLLSAIYVASLIRFATELLSEETTWKQLEGKLQNLAKNTKSNSPKGISFPRMTEGVPERKHGLRSILEYLKRKC